MPCLLITTSDIVVVLVLLVSSASSDAGDDHTQQNESNNHSSGDGDPHRPVCITSTIIFVFLIILRWLSTICLLKRDCNLGIGV